MPRRSPRWSDRMQYDLDFAAPLGYWQPLLAGAVTTLALTVTATVDRKSVV